MARTTAVARPLVVVSAGAGVAVAAFMAWKKLDDLRKRATKKENRLQVCWLTTGRNKMSAGSIPEATCEVCEVTSHDLHAMPASTEVLVAGDPECYEPDAAVECLARAEKLRGVVIPYAGVFPIIASRLAEANTVRVEEGRPELIVANCHFNAPMTAELAVALALAGAKRLVRGDGELRQGDWRGRGLPLPGGPRPAPVIPQLILDGKTVLIVGLGSVGQRVAVALAALGCDVVATARTASKVKTRRLRVGNARVDIRIYPASDFKTLLAGAAIVVLCVPLNAETRGMIGSSEFALMRRDAVLVNVARGPVVDEAALIAALRRRDIAVYASDVWFHYPPDWHSASNCHAIRDSSDSSNAAPSGLPDDAIVFSPHRGGAMGIPEARARLTTGLAHAFNVAATLSIPLGLATKPLGHVNVAAGY